MGRRADALADRILEGAGKLVEFAAGLTDVEWRTPVPGDGRSIAVTVHHVASMYPLEIDLARTLASGKPITGVTAGAINDLNAKHADAHPEVGRKEALDLLRQNSAAAAEAVRRLSDAELDSAASVSLNGDAPLTAQFFIENHALRHSFHHLARMRAALHR